MTVKHPHPNPAGGHCIINLCDHIEFVKPSAEEVDRIARALPNRDVPNRDGRGALIAAAERVARLNPNAGEIGEGMLRTIVDEARDALAVAWLEDNV